MKLDDKSGSVETENSEDKTEADDPQPIKNVEKCEIEIVKNDSLAIETKLEVQVEKNVETPHPQKLISIVPYDEDSTSSSSQVDAETDKDVTAIDENVPEPPQLVTSASLPSKSDEAVDVKVTDNINQKQENIMEREDFSEATTPIDEVEEKSAVEAPEVIPKKLEDVESGSDKILISVEASKETEKEEKGIETCAAPSDDLKVEEASIVEAVDENWSDDEKVSEAHVEPEKPQEPSALKEPETEEIEKDDDQQITAPAGDQKVKKEDQKVETESEKFDAEVVVADENSSHEIDKISNEDVSVEPEQPTVQQTSQPVVEAEEEKVETEVVNISNDVQEEEIPDVASKVPIEPEGASVEKEKIVEPEKFEISKVSEIEAIPLPFEMASPESPVEPEIVAKTSENEIVSEKLEEEVAQEEPSDDKITTKASLVDIETGEISENQTEAIDIEEAEDKSSMSDDVGELAEQHVTQLVTQEREQKPIENASDDVKVEDNDSEINEASSSHLSVNVDASINKVEEEISDEKLSTIISTPAEDCEEERSEADEKVDADKERNKAFEPVSSQKISDRDESERQSISAADKEASSDELSSKKESYDEIRSKETPFEETSIKKASSEIVETSIKDQKVVVQLPEVLDEKLSESELSEDEEISENEKLEDIKESPLVETPKQAEVVEELPEPIQELPKASEPSKAYQELPEVIQELPKVIQKLPEISHKLLERVETEDVSDEEEPEAEPEAIEEVEAKQPEPENLTPKVSIADDKVTAVAETRDQIPNAVAEIEEDRSIAVNSTLKPLEDFTESKAEEEDVFSDEDNFDDFADDRGSDQDDDDGPEPPLDEKKEDFDEPPSENNIVEASPVVEEKVHQPIVDFVKVSMLAENRVEESLLAVQHVGESLTAAEDLSQVKSNSVKEPEVEVNSSGMIPEELNDVAEVAEKPSVEVAEVPPKPIGTRKRKISERKSISESDSEGNNATDTVSRDNSSEDEEVVLKKKPRMRGKTTSPRKVLASRKAAASKRADVEPKEGEVTVEAPVEPPPGISLDVAEPESTPTLQTLKFDFDGTEDIAANVAAIKTMICKDAVPKKESDSERSDDEADKRVSKRGKRVKRGRFSKQAEAESSTDEDSAKQPSKNDSKRSKASDDLKNQTTSPNKKKRESGQKGLFDDPSRTS